MFIEPLEVGLKEENRECSDILRGYGDDLIAVVSRGELGVIQESLNSVPRKVKYTTEVEKDKQLPFLDFSIINNRASLEIDVYRKFEYTRRRMTNDSIHRFTQKMIPCNSMINRMSWTIHTHEAGLGGLI